MGDHGGIHKYMSISIQKEIILFKKNIFSHNFIINY